MVLYYVYLSCFFFGATLLVCQFLLGLLGLGGGHEGPGDHDFGHDLHPHGDAHDANHDHQTSWFVGVLTFRALVAALAFFGVGGLAALQTDVDPLLSLGVAVALGGGALFGVAFLMRTLSKLRADGTVRISRAVGTTGTVYLNIPGGRKGAGKVHLNLQNRTVEYQAVTPAGDLLTGAKVVVVGIVGSDTVEVVSATDPGSIHHA
jgi:amino acid transporter